MDPALVALFGGLTAVFVGLFQWARVREARATASWRHVASRFSLGGPTREKLRGVIDGVEVTILSVERGGEHGAVETHVVAPCVIALTPAYHLRGRRSQHASPALPQTSLGGAQAENYVLRTEDPRAIRTLFTPERADQFVRLGPFASLDCQRGEVLIRILDDNLTPERLESAVGLAVDLAAVGADIRALVLQLECLEAQAEDPHLAAIREISEGLSQITSALGGAPPGPASPVTYDLLLDRGRAALHLNYWRGAPGFCITMESETSLPVFSIRWDEDGERHGVKGTKDFSSSPRKEKRSSSTTAPCSASMAALQPSPPHSGEPPTTWQRSPTKDASPAPFGELGSCSPRACAKRNVSTSQRLNVSTPRCHVDAAPRRRRDVPRKIVRGTSQTSHRGPEQDERGSEADDGVGFYGAEAARMEKN